MNLIDFIICKKTDMKKTVILRFIYLQIVVFFEFQI